MLKQYKLRFYNFRLILFLIANATGKTHDEKVLRIFFPEKFED